MTTPTGERFRLGSGSTRWLAVAACLAVAAGACGPDSEESGSDAGSDSAASTDGAQAGRGGGSGTGGGGSGTSGGRGGAAGTGGGGASGTGGGGSGIGGGAGWGTGSGSGGASGTGSGGPPGPAAGAARSGTGSGGVSGTGGRGGAAGSGSGGGSGTGGAPATGVVAAGVRWVGRVDIANPQRPRFSWSGTGFVARFSGTSLAMQINSTGAFIFKAVVDGSPRPAFTIPAGQQTATIASGLAAGMHTVELYRQTEGSQGNSQLIGAHRGWRRAGGPASAAAAPHRGHRRLHQLRVRHARCARRQRLLPDREPLGHLRRRRGAHARRRDQHHRDVGSGRLPELRRRHEQHAADGLHARADQRRHAGVGLPRAPPGRHRQPRDQRHQQQQR